MRYFSHFLRLFVWWSLLISLVYVVVRCTSLSQSLSCTTVCETLSLYPCCRLSLSRCKTIRQVFIKLLECVGTCTVGARTLKFVVVTMIRHYNGKIYGWWFIRRTHKQCLWVLTHTDEYAQWRTWSLNILVPGVCFTQYNYEVSVLPSKFTKSVLNRI